MRDATSIERVLRITVPDGVPAYGAPPQLGATS